MKPGAEGARGGPLAGGSRAAVWGLGIAQAVAFPAAVAGLFWFLLYGA